MIKLMKTFFTWDAPWFLVTNDIIRRAKKMKIECGSACFGRSMFKPTFFVGFRCVALVK